MFFRITPIVFFLLLIPWMVLRAQSLQQKAVTTEQAAPFWDNVWWGIGPNIGFSSNNQSSTFGIGVFGQAGYKFTPMISFGPRMSFFYNSVKYVGYKNLNLFNVELGGFLRAKVWRSIFLQGDLSNTWKEQPGEPTSNNTISKYKTQRFNQWVGGGWNGGNGKIGTEISYHYNIAIANDLDAYEAPWEFRFMITWKF